MTRCTHCSRWRVGIEAVSPFRLSALREATAKQRPRISSRRCSGRRFPVHATHANLNNEIGVPLTVLQMDRKHRGLVVEMGMRAHGEIRQLAQIVRPTIGVVTNVGPVHVEFLGSLAGVAAAKAELVEQLPAHGVAVLNGDDPYVAAMAAQTDAQVVTFGLNPNVDRPSLRRRLPGI